MKVLVQGISHCGSFGRRTGRLTSKTITRDLNEIMVFLSNPVPVVCQLVPGSLYFSSIPTFAKSIEHARLTILRLHELAKLSNQSSFLLVRRFHPLFFSMAYFSFFTLRVCMCAKSIKDRSGDIYCLF